MYTCIQNIWVWIKKNSYPFKIDSSYGRSSPTHMALEQMRFDPCAGTSRRSMGKIENKTSANKRDNETWLIESCCFH